jgi:hypothetical protein
MKRTQLVVLVLVAVALCIAAWFVVTRSTTSWRSNTGRTSEKVVNLPINDVAAIRIKQPDGEVNLEREGDKWVVAERANYQANFETISTFIRQVWDLKPGQDVKVGPSQLGRLELLESGKGAEAGTLVEFKNAQGKRLAALRFGKKYMRESNQSFAPGRSFPAGRYVMPEGNSQQVTLVSQAFQQVDNKPERWLDREFIRIEKPVSVACAGVDPAMSWKLEKDHASTDWKLADLKPGEQLDQTKARQVASAVGNVSSFTDVLAPDAAANVNGLDKPVVFTIATEDGFSYVLKVGKNNNESYPITVGVNANFPAARTPGKDEKPEEKTKLDKEFQTKKEALEKKLTKEKAFEGRPFLVSKYTIEQLEKKRVDLLAPKPTPTPSLGSSAAPRRD